MSPQTQVVSPQAITINNQVPPINPLIAKKVAERIVSEDKRKKLQKPQKSPNAAVNTSTGNAEGDRLQYTLVR